jgi:MATE family multidrug resistance protein
MGPVVLATQSVLLVSASTTFQAPYALSIAAAVRVGNLLGEAKSERAVIASKAAFFIAFLIGIGWRCEFHAPPAVGLWTLTDSRVQHYVHGL